MTQTVVFMDLDDTIFQTRRKCATERLSTGALGPDGHPMSFLEPAQERLFRLLRAEAVVIPVTARDRASFARVRLDFHHGAILNYGGTILNPDGSADPIWTERARRTFGRAAASLAEAKRRADKIIEREGLCCRARIIGDDGLDLYLVVKNFDNHVEQLDTVRENLLDFATANGMSVFANDNNLSVLPSTLNKAAAVSYVLDTRLRPEHGEMLAIGMGDSHSDVDFLRLCDFMLIPSRSQIAKGLVR